MALPIAVLASGAGRLGFCPCPRTRDDVVTIRAWGAGLVVTLVEQTELVRLGVPDLGAWVRAAGMAWRHLPIVDFGVPDAGFEAGWTTLGLDIQARLAAGGSVLLHCQGGRGRSGLIAARVLVEGGMAPDAAIAAVRAVQPRAIETKEQAAYLRGGFG